MGDGEDEVGPCVGEDERPDVRRGREEITMPWWHLVPKMKLMLSLKKWKLDGQETSWMTKSNMATTVITSGVGKEV